MIAVCENCLEEYMTVPSWFNRSERHFCSKPCSMEASLDRRRQQILAIGKESRFKLGQKPSPKRKIPKGTGHHAWKGESVGYRGLHYWLRRVRGEPTECQWCGNYPGQWANIDGLYRRNPDDFVSLCASCHKQYDLAIKAANEDAQDSI